MVTKTRAQDGDSKGKGFDGNDSIEQRISQMEELNDQRFARWEEKFDQRFSRLEEMIVALGVSGKQTQADQRESFTKPQGIQESEEHSTLERDTSPLSKTKGGGSGSFTRIRDDRKPEGEGQWRTDSHRSYSHLTRMGKIEFPKFDGNDMKGWLFKAEEFFGLDYTPPEMKVRMASIHFEGFAAKWHQNFIESDVGMSVRTDWKSYVHFMKDMFEEEDDDPMAELKNLREKEGIRDYHQKFETVRTRLRLPEDYLVSVYLAGLRTDTRMHVKMFRPETVRDCYYLGKTYEKANPKQAVTTSWGSRGVSSGGYSKNQKEVGNQSEQITTKVIPKPVDQQARKLSPQEMSDRRSKGLCYFCDEKFTPEHYAAVHKKIQLCFMNAGAGDEFEDAEDELCEEEANAGPMPRISVNAVSGISDYKTMRVKGTYNKKILFILIDSGSTHNFLDPKAARRLGCKVEKAGLTKVAVADGRKLQVDGRIDNFEWKMQTTTFQSDILLIPLQGIDMVLGVQWLETLGDILWDFKKLDMRFKFQNQKVWLHGIKSGSVRDIKAKRLQKIQEDQVQLAMLCVHKAADKEQEDFCTVNAITTEGGTGSAINVVLEKFPDAFAEPTELPPFREAHNHKIQLLEGSNPVNQRPCRYAIHQKSENDRIVEDLIKGGTFRPSSSHSASSVVLVKKKEGICESKVVVVACPLQEREIMLKLRILVDNVPTTTHLPSLLQDVFEQVPDKILEKKREKRQGGAVGKVLEQWLNEPVEEATWFLFDLQKKYPEFFVDNLEVKVLWEGGDVIQDHTCE